MASSAQPVFHKVRIVVRNERGENLVGILHDSGSGKVAILCHGFQSSKDDAILLNFSYALNGVGLSTFRFDFAGNGESEGSFQYGNYRKEAEDLRAIVLYFLKMKNTISAIIGHSKGGNVVLLYASRYGDVHSVINISGRFALDRGIAGRLGDSFREDIKKNGFIDVKDKKGQVEYHVTEESLMDRLTTDMHAACLSIDKSCSVLTIHGSDDKIVPLEDALEFSKLIANHRLHIIEGANHVFSSHQPELASAILDFLSSDQVHISE